LAQYLGIPITTQLKNIPVDALAKGIVHLTKPLRIKVSFSRKELQSLIFGAFSFFKDKNLHFKYIYV